MTPSETPRYDADRPRYRPGTPSFRKISHVIATAGPNGDVLGATIEAPAAAVETEADCERAAADAAIGLGRPEGAAGAADTLGVTRLFAESWSLVFTTVG